MRLLGLLVGSLALLQSAAAASVERGSDEPVVLAVGNFPESNAFGHVVNGERNTIYVSIESQESERNVTLKSIAGSLHNVETNRLVKNLTKLDYGFPLIEGAPLQLPFAFHSEYKPGDYKLSVWVEHSTEGQTYRVTAYDSIITVVEPEGSIFDFKLWTTYLAVLTILGGAGYYAYTTLVPQPKKRKSPPQVSAPVGTVTATGAGGYQEEWIPEHHLKQTSKKSKAKSSGVATSGDETSGVESGVEGRKRRGKK